MLSRITIDGTKFRDAHGREVILRGVNLGGDSKVPFAPDGRTFLPTDFSDHRIVSFVGRPAPLAELDEHLARIAGWGFNCLRLLTTWEAVEHAGPGQYDEAYLDYYAEVCRRSGEHGLYVLVDFHQDVWSRMSGGDGAPGWTWEAAGLDFTAFDEADAALLMQQRYDPALGGRQDGYPVMSWGGNYRMAANAIIWTLFFAGERFAPSARVHGASIQAYLQHHYCGAMRKVAERLVDMDHVLGFDSLNEPGSGWIGQGLDERRGLLRGPAWSPLDGLAVASGIPRTVPVLEGGERLMNAAGRSIWLPGHDDPFRAAGAWDIDGSGQPAALLPDHFRKVDGDDVDHERDHMLPFYHRVADTMRSVRPDWLLFAEADPFRAFSGQGFPQGMPERTVNASHWYDLAALVTKRIDPNRSVDLLSGAPIEGRGAIAEHYRRGLARLKAIGDDLNGGAPTLIGEFGIPYDCNDGAAYAAFAAGDHSDAPWSAHVAALSQMYDAMDALGLSSTQWNYTASNRNDPMIGDGWNQEDLSIWSIDQQVEGSEQESGGRAILGFSRPYAQAIQGSLIAQSYDVELSRYRLEYEADAACPAPTCITLPYHDSAARWVLAYSGGRLEQGDSQALLWVGSTDRMIVEAVMGQSTTSPFALHGKREPRDREELPSRSPSVPQV